MEFNYIIKEANHFIKCRVLDIYMSGHKGFIAGGCFKNIFNNQKIKDVDIFFEQKEHFDEALNFYKQETNYTIVYENEKAVCFLNKDTNVKIELIKTFFKNVEDTLNSFDFTITKFAYYKDTENDNVIYSYKYLDSFFEDLHCNRLVIDNRLDFPISSFERSYRYKSYGFVLCKESKVKLIDALKNSNSDDISNDLYNSNRLRIVRLFHITFWCLTKRLTGAYVSSRFAKHLL